MAIIGGKAIKQNIEFRNTLIPLLQNRFAFICDITVDGSSVLGLSKK